METLSDEELVDLTRQGDLAAFNRLTARWESSLYRFLRRNLGNHEDALDLCQETLVKAYLNIERLREGSKFKTWVHQIAMNLCRDRYRRVKVQGTQTPLEDAESPLMMAVSASGGGPATERRSDRAGLMIALEDALGRLPPEQRTAILLREYHGFTSEEIGEMTEVPATTVRTRIFYGLRTVRRLLKERGITEGVDAT